MTAGGFTRTPLLAYDMRRRKSLEVWAREATVLRASYFKYAALV